MATSLERRGKSTDSIFELEIGRTDAGSVRLRFKPRRPLRSFYGHERQLAALVYALAAELEQRAGVARVGWAISPEPFNQRIDIEVEGPGEFVEAQAFLMETLVDLRLESLIVK